MNGCGKYEEELDRILRGMPGKSVEPPAHLRAKILGSLPEEPDFPVWRRWGIWAAGLGAAAACLIAAVVFYRGIPTPSPTPAVTAGPAPRAAAEAPPPPSAPKKSKLPAAAGKSVKPPAEPERAVREVKISFFHPTARCVAVTGDFNDWNREGILLAAGERGLWKATLLLRPGAYSYNFIVDGNLLVPDPNASQQTPDGFGGTNSILVVSGRKPA